MELTESYFSYNGVFSRKYNLIIANVNTEPMERMVGEIKTNTVFNKGDNRKYIVGESFEDSPLEFEAEIVTDDGRPIPVHIRRDVEKWLFHTEDFCKLYFDMECDPYGETIELVNGEQKQLYLNCRLIKPERLNYNGGVVGYKFTVECDSCMAWQDPAVFTYNLNHGSGSSSSTITIPVDTDMNGFIYPKCVIQMGGSGGNISIVNTSDDTARKTEFVSLLSYSKVTMRGGGVNYISGNNFQNFSGMNFVRLKDGENKLTVTGNVSSISFEFQNRRYL